MPFLKPLFRTFLLSIVLALLIVYLGIKYHWSDYLKPRKPSEVSSLEIPPLSHHKMDANSLKLFEVDTFTPEIIPLSEGNDLISSMTKEQVKQHCNALLSRSIKTDEQLSLAVINCVVSNYQEPLQTINDESYLLKKEKFYQACKKQFIHNKNYSIIERQLLIGICTSDKVVQ